VTSHTMVKNCITLSGTSNIHVTLPASIYTARPKMTKQLTA